jgi:cold shock CspA family protein
MRGVVDTLLIDRGFGFIAAGGERYFFNQAALQGLDFEDLGPGTEVEFEIDRDPAGDRPDEEPRAVSIRLADGAVPAVDHEVLPPEKLGWRG